MFTFRFAVDTRTVPSPHYPFGFGLSYTRFEIDAPSVSGIPAEGVEVKTTLTNTGDRAGAEVLQLYVEDEQSSVIRPPRELKAFAKVFLEPGASEEVSFQLTPRDFSFWDDSAKDWKLESGAFLIGVGAHSRSLKTVRVTQP